jgi:hypothetical protein
MTGLIGSPYPRALTTSVFAGLAAVIVGVSLFHACRKKHDPVNRGALIFVALTASYIFVSLLWDIWIHR